VSPAEGQQLLGEAITRGANLLDNRPVPKDAYAGWQLFTRNCLEKSFGTNSSSVKDVMGVSKFEGMFYDNPEHEQEAERAKYLGSQLSRLRPLVDLLAIQAGPAKANPLKTSTRGGKVFLVHGHDERMLQECARFLERLDQEVVILREQSNQGRTIIDKFEQVAQEAGFAVVLLTADDHGGPAGATAEQLKPRSRQNVIFELGYFVGRLGRKYVCALFEPGVELPSDYSGVLYEELDNRATWKIHLARELRDAGMSVDLNKAM
jgi:predicted nucleotide-binding protein